MSTRSALLLAVIVFLATLLARLPARLLVPLLPAEVACDMPSGTVWHGACAQLHAPGLTLNAVSWTLHPSALLGLRLSADLTSDDPHAQGHAGIELSRGGLIRVQALAAQLPLQDGLKLFPRGLAGTVQVAVSLASVRHGELTALQGSVRVVQLRSNSQSADLGSFELQFPAASAGSPIVGQLRDLGGPLSVSGALRLTRGAYDLSGWVAARDQASPELLQALQLLGPADAQGRRMFSLAGSL